MARTLGIADGEMVRLRHAARHGDCSRARLEPSIRMDTVFVPFHWGGEGCANLLTSPALDPVSHIPEFKVCAARDRENAELPCLTVACQLPDGKDTMETTPRFLNGVFPFTGSGPGQVGAARHRAGLHRAGGQALAADLLPRRQQQRRAGLLSLMRDGKLMRMFPIGAKGAMHVPLAVVEDLMPDSKLEVFVAAPAGVSGSVVLDIGLMEI